ncbi:MAG: methylated-DNA--[protein]-cysteine S-methyltransferase [Bryobacteraceae bacterium]|jgi:methylated-DNA-[protein]-cysteine S-methyltransferase
MPWATVDAAPGFSLYIEATEESIAQVLFERPATVDGEPDDAHPAIREAARQLAEYFARTRRAFELPLGLRGTPFQLRVWNALLGIPYGETRTYSQLALQLGQPGAARAVGAANGANPVSIIVPCHRVIAAGGGLGGYGGGLDRKKFLLDLESGASTSLINASA